MSLSAPPAPAAQRADRAVSLLVDRAEAARMASISTRTLDRLISQDAFPKPDKNLSAKLKRWRRETVEVWCRA